MASLDMCELLRVCVRGCTAAQRYLMHEMLRIQDINTHMPSSSSARTAHTVLDLAPAQRRRLLDTLKRSILVRVKSELAYKDGSAAHDLVTSADVLTQAVIVCCLRRAFPQLPFTLVGEEEGIDGNEGHTERTSDSRARGLFNGTIAHATTYKEHSEEEEEEDALDENAEMRRRMAHCMRVYYRAHEPIPYEDALRQHMGLVHGEKGDTNTTRVGVVCQDDSSSTLCTLTAHASPDSSNSDNSKHNCAFTSTPNPCETSESAAIKSCGCASASPWPVHAPSPHRLPTYTLKANDVRTLRRRVSIYIDPIDGTGCFVDGVWEAPVTLIGVALDGVPVMAVMNRVFDYPMCSTGAAATGASCVTPPAILNNAVFNSATTASSNNTNHHSLNKSSTGQEREETIDAHDTRSLTHSSVSYVWNMPPYDRSEESSHVPFMVYRGRLICSAMNPLNGSSSSSSSTGHSSDARIQPTSTGRNRNGHTQSVLHTNTHSTNADESCATLGSLPKLAKHPHAHPSHVLRVCQSTTTRRRVLSRVQHALQPMQPCHARGAGHKQCMLIEAMLASRQRHAPTRDGSGEADVFISPGHSIKKWDCCAPHAFVRALGGEVYSLRGLPLRYDVATGTLCGEEAHVHPPNTSSTTELDDLQHVQNSSSSSSDNSDVSKSSGLTEMHDKLPSRVRHNSTMQQMRMQTPNSSVSDASAAVCAVTLVTSSEVNVELPDGVVAVTREAKTEVARRLGWSAAHAEHGGDSHL